MKGIRKSSELRQKEHVDSKLIPVEYDGTQETCPYKVGDLYDGREVISLGFTQNVYGNYYHIIVERDRTNLRTKFQFDSKHDLKFSKPVERMSGNPQDMEKQLRKYLPDGLAQDTAE